MREKLRLEHGKRAYPQVLLVTVSVAFWFLAENTTPGGGGEPKASALMANAVPVRSITPAAGGEVQNGGQAVGLECQKAGHNARAVLIFN